MPTLHVCSLSRLAETATRVGAGRVLTIINEGSRVVRPSGVAEADHLFVGVNDVTAPLDGHRHPAAEHVAQVLAFARAWDRARPLVVHCWAGVSRSTASAYAIACALAPARDEAAIARALRAASPSATPNALIVRLADEALGRGGRMVAAIEAIGRGADCFENEPFELALDELAPDELALDDLPRGAGGTPAGPGP